jgi:hypothetical protein
MTDSGYKYLDNRKIAAMTELRIPARMQGAIIRYVEDGIPPGNFLGAVIDNDLKEAFARADDENASLIGNYIKWLYNYAPAKCWGRENSQPTWRKLLHQIAMDVGAE